MEKILVVYYSLEGNTRFIAEALAREIGADILELKPKKDIDPKGGMKFMWGGRQAIMKKKPDLHTLEKKPDEYDIIFIGTPVWAWTFTPAVRSFLIDNPLKGKKIALFCTHGGGPKEAMAKLEAAVTGNNIIGKLELGLVLDEEPEQKKAQAIAWARKVLADI